MKWNDKVKTKIKKIDQVTTWLKSVEKNANNKKDWHTERNSARAIQYLKLALVEMYDMEYEEDPQGKKLWDKRTNRD